MTPFHCLADETSRMYMELAMCGTDSDSLDLIRAQSDLQYAAIGSRIIAPIDQFPDPQPAFVLDVGHGSAQRLLSFATTYPPTQSYGAKDGEGLPRLKDAYPRNMHSVPLNLARGPQGLNGKFDLINAQNFFYWLPERLWEQSIQELRAFLRPGGFLQVIEFGSLFRRSGSCGRMTRLRTHKAGLANDRISSLPEHLQMHGFTTVSISTHKMVIGDQSPSVESREKSIAAIMP